ncbi:MscS mechanosensitive ion channel [Burkholderia multivorans]|uniref:mechanosensitive ion channel family protein n=1 Tax=Burkholderia multivorans TaxID=87883 RepID=UPI0006A588FE|nr:mechanosensitive ion channel family protein [Burkholderia multivorans]KOE23801.1 mechanosensitive ion channel protein MscS [Burkholderia multivorans R-20526]MBU9243677.1 mechanosensitive ion channel family protein [Burkholderia multivorans]MCO7336479.1 mechanosensitive ion channel family protein [Burkholderia multivorans]MCO7343168.1 mechanosensitive ion channel family protein [Burkholderia multivorans]MCO7346403.1 mechanosensitive ion channel family protein [Burkholderia multivorans]
MTLNESWFAPLVGTLVLLAAAGVVTAAVHFLLFRVVARLARRSATRIDDALFQFGAFKWLNRIVPFVVIKLGLGAVPGLPDAAAQAADKVLFALIVFVVTMTISATLSALEHTYRTTRREQPRLSLKGAMQLVKLVMFITAALVVIGDATGKQIGLLLSGIGAMSAVLMLIFKDTLLGLVAGVQLSSNDMLRIGDWITMPSAGADGTVIDITLNTVKVANFDHTIITVPTWKLITESYQNWRGMTEAGGRRIKRALFIDATSVRFLTNDEIARLERLTLLKDYLDEKVDAITQWNGALGAAAECPANRRQLTNLGTFRAYVANYLQWHPRIRRDMTCMARQLPLTAEGIPLELYCFTDTTTWVDYEAIQSDLFDHLIAILPAFGLRVYQHPSGFDMREMTGAVRADARRAAAEPTDDAETAIAA